MLSGNSGGNVKRRPHYRPRR